MLAPLAMTPVAAGVYLACRYWPMRDTVQWDSPDVQRGLRLLTSNRTTSVDMTKRVPQRFILSKKGK